jgi:hypothetical protein
MSLKIGDLRTKSDEDLIEAHDRLSEHTIVGTDYYLQELSRRESVRQTKAMVVLTRTIHRLTWVIAILTALNVGLVAGEVLR